MDVGGGRVSRVRRRSGRKGLFHIRDLAAWCEVRNRVAGINVDQSWEDIHKSFPDIIWALDEVYGFSSRFTPIYQTLNCSPSNCVRPSSKDAGQASCQGSWIGNRHTKTVP